jgi:hypothetical protein
VTSVPLTAAPSAAYDILFSQSADRSDATALDGQTVSGDIYVFVGPETGITQVRFYVDDPSASGTANQTENDAPWDFAGGAITAASPYDTSELSDGPHTITALVSLTSGETAVTTATLTVNNAALTNTPVPPTATATVRATATATQAPTATTPPAEPTAAATSAPTTTAAPTGTAMPAAMPESAATYIDEYAGWALDYPADWSLVDVTPQIKAESLAYSITFMSWKPEEVGGKGVPPGGSKLDANVTKNDAATLDEAVARRRAEIAASQPEAQITGEESWELASGLQATRWQIMTPGGDTVYELVASVNGHRIVLSGYGDPAVFDQIARSFRAVE